ncbi:4-hydroxy-tetrahydrodipicolinate synthase [Flavobacteriales bacterium]|nr:4-hydroxy-tetrahydrodipicolinate synthase [Flavobacteriales bacterium]
MKITGTGVALVTPFKNDSSIDFDALKRLIQHVGDGGVDFLVVLGTTGETASLSNSEKQEVFDFVKNNNPLQLDLVAGLASNNTHQLLCDLESYDLSGYQALLSASPSYNKPSQEGIYQHFKALAKKSVLPIILYNVPGRTASNMTAKTTIRLAKDFDNIVAIKEASGDLNQLMEIVDNRPEGFNILSGEDNLTLPMLSVGADGAISVSANAFPEQHSRMINFALGGDFASAHGFHYELFHITNLLFKEGNPAGIKHVLAEKKIIDNHLRLPLTPVSSDLEREIKESLNN